MKICPMCGRAFASDVAFCLDDGTRLTHATPSAADVPTQIFTPAITASPAARGGNPVLYGIIGALAAVIGTVAIFLLFFKGDADRISNTNTPSANAVNSVSRNEKAATPTSPDTATPAKVTEQDARNLIDRWARSQNEKDFARYQSCYAPEMIAVKETTKGTSQRLTYRQWMADRRKMTRNFLNVEAIDPTYQPEGELVVVSFRQRWRSLNYCDIGRKVITMKMFPDGPKIVSEKITDPVPC